MAPVVWFSFRTAHAADDDFAIWRHENSMVANSLVDAAWAELLARLQYYATSAR